MPSTVERIPRLYLDIDGVLMPFGGPPDYGGSPFSFRQINQLESYSPEVVERLGRTGLELVWCTTLAESEVSYLVNAMDAFRGGRQLRLRGQSRQIIQKRSAILEDQATSPAPYVWVDDSISRGIRSMVAARTRPQPHLIIAPDRNMGINEKELSNIESFARQTATG